MSISSIIFSLLFLGGLGMALLRHPMYGLYTYVAVFYLHPPSRWWAADLPDLRWSLVAAAVTLVATYRLAADPSRPTWLATTPGKVLVLFTLWVLLQNLWALDATDHLELTVLYAKYVVLFYIIYRLIDTVEKLTDFVVAHVVGCFYLGWLAFNATFAGRLESVGGPGINESNSLGMQMGTAVAMGSMLVLSYPGWRRWLAIAAMPFILNTLVLTGSRSAFLGLLAACIVLALLKPMAHRKLFYRFAVLGLVLGGMLAHGIFWERMGTIKVAAQDSEQADNSAQTRLLLAHAQLKMAAAYPFGTGHRGTAVLSPDYLPATALARALPGTNGQAARSSHNTFLTLLVEQGIPGTLVFSFLWFWFMKQAIEFRRLANRADAAGLCAMAAGLTAAFAAVHISGIFVDYLKAEIQIWCLALGASASVLTKTAIRRRNFGVESASAAAGTPVAKRI